MDDGAREITRIVGLEDEVKALRLALSGAVLLLIDRQVGNFGPDAYDVAWAYYTPRVDPEGCVEPNIYAGLEFVNKAMAN